MEAWSGHYQHAAADGTALSDRHLFRLAMERSWYGRLHGRAEFELRPEFATRARLHGSLRWRRINMTWFPETAFTIEPGGFVPLPHPSQHGSGGSEHHLAPGMPLAFRGRVRPSGKEAAGTWVVTTWMMESETRRKVQVILAQGTWHMERVQTSE